MLLSQPLKQKLYHYNMRLNKDLKAIETCRIVYTIKESGKNFNTKTLSRRKMSRSILVTEVWRNPGNTKMRPFDSNNKLRL